MTTETPYGRFDSVKMTVLSQLTGDKISNFRNNSTLTAGYEMSPSRWFMARPLLYLELEINPNGGETDGKERDT
jgi:hypothetical protein